MQPHSLAQIIASGDVFPGPPAAGQSVWDLGSHDLWVGDFDVGSLTVSSGVLRTGAGHLGLFSDGSLALTGSGSSWTIGQGGLEVGVWAGGRLDVLGGATVDIEGNLHAVLDDLAAAEIRIAGEGSRLDVHGSLEFLSVGDGTSSLVLQSGGVVQVAGNMRLPQASLFSFSGGRLEIGGSLEGWDGPLVAGTTLLLTGEDAVWRLTSPTTVGGILGGVGHVSDDLRVVSGGQLALGTAGDPLGRLRIGGDLIMESDSAIQLTVGRLYDVSRPWSALDVLGAADVRGGVVRVTTIDDVPVGSMCRFLRTPGTLNVSQAFDFNVPERFNVTSGFDTDDYWFVLTHNPDFYPDLAQTPNQNEVAEYLEEVADTAPSGSDVDYVLDQFNHLPDSDARDALDQIGGQSLASGASNALVASSVVVGTVMDQLRPSARGRFGSGSSCTCLAADRGGARCTCAAEELSAETSCLGPCIRGRAFLRGFGQAGSIASDGNARAIESSIGGTILGFQQELDDRTEWGGFYAYGKSFVNTQELTASSETGTHWFGAVHSHVSPQGAYYMASWTLGFDRYASDRRITFGQIDRVARAATDGWQSTLYGECGLLGGTTRLGVQPFFALQQSYLRQNGILEEGAGALDLAAGGIDTSSLRSVLGMRVEWSPGGGPCGPQFEFRGKWTHELLNRRPPTFHATLADVGGSGFHAAGIDPGSDWATLGAGLRWPLENRCHVFFDYDAQFDHRQCFHVAAGGIEMRPTEIPMIFRFAGELSVGGAL